MLDTVGGPYTRIVYKDYNLNSHDQVKKYLLSQGWEPTTYNRVRDEDGKWRTTSPKLTEDSFHTIKGDMGKLIARRSILTHRRRFIENYDDPENKGALAYVREDGRVPAQGILCQTPTARTGHRGAICNVPGEDAPLGPEIRALYGVKEPEVMLGADLDQIEARVTAHYAWLYDGGDYWRVLESVDDIHQHNADKIGVDRRTAKAFQYALFYGAKAPKIATIANCSLKQAEVYVDDFWSANKGVYDLIKGLEEYFNEYGFIAGLDGRKIFIRAKYKLLNSLIQTAAGILWKKWGCLANERLRESLVDCHQIIAYHDEYDYRCEKLAVPLASSIIKTAALDAGKYFNFKVPITVDIKVGQNWAEIH